MTPREYTADEVRKKFLEHVWNIITFWQEVEDPSRDRIEGTVFSILAMIDGTVPDLPGFVVAPAPHEDDREYRKKHGKNYFSKAPEAPCNIAGNLHELFSKMYPGRKR